MANESKSVVLSVRLTGDIKDALVARAVAERQPSSRMASMIVEDALGQGKAFAVNARLEAELVERGILLEAQGKRITELISTIDRMSTDNSRIIEDQQRFLDEAQNRIAELEASLARAERPTLRPVVVAATYGAAKPVAAVLPVSGTQYPPRPVHLRGEKGKKS
jgi:hypothetical protein